MRDINILFSTPMVQAQLADWKTMTRRVVRGQALEWLETDFSPMSVADPANRLSPYGYAGDTLVTRETFFAWGKWEKRYSAKKGRDEWHFVDMTLECGRSYAYDTDPDTPMVIKRRSTVVPLWWRRPAIFMPKAAVRIRRKITAVRIERLQDISDEDAIAEGIPLNRTASGVPMTDSGHTMPKAMFQVLWVSINGQESWDANPYVWCISFEGAK